MAEAKVVTPEFQAFMQNVVDTLPSTYTMIMSVFVLIGLITVFSGVMDLAQSTDKNKKHFAAGKMPTYWGGVSKILIGGIMCMMGTNLEWVSVAASVYMGTDANFELVSVESYLPASEVESLETRLTKIALLGVAQIVGIIAVFKGLRIWSKIADGSSRESGWHGFAYMIFGSMCVQLAWMGQLVENTLGFNFFSIIGF